MIREGYLAEFAHEHQLIEAIARLRAKGYERMDAYTPYPVKGLEEALGLRRSRLPLVVFPIAMAGAAAAYLIQWYTNAVSYRLVVGGRPPHGWPAFIPITFETGVLAAGVAAFVLTLAAARLPQPSFTLADVPGFERASSDRFWLLVDAADPRFDPRATAADLRATGSLRVAGLGREVA